MPPSPPRSAISSPRGASALLRGADPARDYEEVSIETARKVTKPDVSVLRVSDRLLNEGPIAIARPPLTGTVAQAVPVHMVSVEVREVGSARLVTAIEILSPVNKRRGHEARDEYVEKRRKLMRSPVHLVEIDLLRNGERLPTQEELPDAPYFVFVHRGRSSPEIGIWPLSFTSRLPVLPVPLLVPDPDQPLDLGAAVSAIYDRASYDLRIDYTKPPPKPDLPPDIAVWLAGAIAERDKQ